METMTTTAIPSRRRAIALARADLYRRGHLPDYRPSAEVQVALEACHNIMRHPRAVGGGWHPRLWQIEDDVPPWHSGRARRPIAL